MGIHFCQFSLRTSSLQTGYRRSGLNDDYYHGYMEAKTKEDFALGLCVDGCVNRVKPPPNRDRRFYVRSFLRNYGAKPDYAMRSEWLTRDEMVDKARGIELVEVFH